MLRTLYASAGKLIIPIEFKLDYSCLIAYQQICFTYTNIQFSVAYSCTGILLKYRLN